MAGWRFLCVGAAHWDMIARAARAPAPGADLPGRIRRRPGGVALNVALALARAGMPTALRAVFGDDGAGRALRGLCADAGVDTAPSLTVAGPGDSYLAIEGPTGELFAAVADTGALERAGRALIPPPGPARLVIDGNLAPEVLAALRDRPRVVVAASPAKAAALAGLLSGALVVANRAEAEAICAAPLPDAARAARALMAHAARALVTDGPRPAALAAPGGLWTAAPLPVAGGSVTGAGDAFLAGFLAAEARGADPDAALAAAIAAAAGHMTRSEP